MKLIVVEQDSLSVVGELSKAASSSSSGLHSVVPTFADGIGNFVSAIGQQVFQMTVNQLGCLLEQFNLAAICPVESLLDELLYPVGAMVSPKDAKFFLDSPSVGGLGVRLLDLFKASLLSLGLVTWGVTPKLACTSE